ncbi:hypothetical protein EON64_16950 [archaeon]|nr:MAG: hypothetical protein EON64_16950 [archaeon]
MKTMLFAFLLVCAFAWTFAVEEVTVNAHKMLADKFGLTKLKQLLKDHDIDLDQVTAEGSNLRGVEVEEAVATQAAEPRFAYIALFGADDCSGPITYMQSLRFDICQTIQARNSYRLVYTGLHNGDHGIDMEIFNNRNCRGDPVGKDKFGDAPDTCDKGFQVLSFNIDRYACIQISLLRIVI